MQATLANLNAHEPRNPMAHCRPLAIPLMEIGSLLLRPRFLQKLLVPMRRHHRGPPTLGGHALTVAPAGPIGLLAKPEAIALHLGLRSARPHQTRARCPVSWPSRQGTQSPVT